MPPKAKIQVLLLFGPVIIKRNLLKGTERGANKSAVKSKQRESSPALQRCNHTPMQAPLAIPKVFVEFGLGRDSESLVWVSSFVQVDAPSICPSNTQLRIL
jgi:hypothetical protein